MEHGVASLRFGQRRLVGSGSHESIVDIYHLQHTRQYWDIVALEAVGIARTVPVFMMVANNWQHLAEGFQRLANGLAVGQVMLHHNPFGGREFTSLLQDLIWNL